MNWLRKWMYGRYGVDTLNNCLFIFYLITFVISLLYYPIRALSLLFALLFIYRTFSKQYYKRRAENELFLRKTTKIRKWYHRQKNKYQYRHTHKYFKCPHCHQYLRVPKGKGDITITCPKCHQQFDRRT